MKSPDVGVLALEIGHVVVELSARDLLQDGW